MKLNLSLKGKDLLTWDILEIFLNYQDMILTELSEIYCFYVSPCGAHNRRNVMNHLQSVTSVTISNTYVTLINLVTLLVELFENLCSAANVPAQIYDHRFHLGISMYPFRDPNTANM
jgi:hypothetical protein